MTLVHVISYFFALRCPRHVLGVPPGASSVLQALPRTLWIACPGVQRSRALTLVPWASVVQRVQPRTQKTTNLITLQMQLQSRAARRPI